MSGNSILVVEDEADRDTFPLERAGYPPLKSQTRRKD